MRGFKEEYIYDTLDLDTSNVVVSLASTRFTKHVASLVSGMKLRIIRTE